MRSPFNVANEVKCKDESSPSVEGALVVVLCGKWRGENARDGWREGRLLG